VLLQICLALQYVHAAGVLHRDLKSSNVLMTTQSSFGAVQLLKLGDFGVAKMNGPGVPLLPLRVAKQQMLLLQQHAVSPSFMVALVVVGCLAWQCYHCIPAFDAGQ
jgi:serine/threonine protein kinase